MKKNEKFKRGRNSGGKNGLSVACIISLQRGGRGGLGKRRIRFRSIIKRGEKKG